MRLNTSDPAVHQEGIGTSDEAAHSGTPPCTGSVSAFGTWHDVEKTLPFGKEVIGWDGEVVTTFFPATGEPPNCGIERCRYLGMTHWMPLPNPPNTLLADHRTEGGSAL
jgi:hypothetical protein